MMEKFGKQQMKTMFDAREDETGVHFDMPMRVNVLVKPA